MQSILVFLKQSWSHILFVLLNFIIVAANIVFPRFLDRPVLSIVSADGLVDESEIKLSNTTAFVVAEIVEASEHGTDYFANTRCYSALKDSLLVPNSCRQLALDAAEKIISQAVVDREAKLTAIRNIEEYDRQKLIEALETKNHYYYRSSYFNEIFFNFLAVDTFADPAISPQIKESLIDAAIGLVNKEFSYVDTFQVFKQELELRDGEIVRSGRMAFRVIVSNSGHADDVIYPEAVLQIGGEEVKVVQAHSEQINSPALGLSNNYSVVQSGEITALYFIVDPSLNTEKSNKLIAEIARQASPLPFRLSIETGSGTVSSESTLAVDSMSFELEFTQKK